MTNRICAVVFVIVMAAGLAVTGCSRRPSEESARPPRGGLSPREALAKMQLAPGFTATLFAHEPEIRQPIAMNWDDRGRMWVVEYLQYPDPAGLKALEWDRYFRTKYDRVPEPPPHGPKGADQIKILEDRDRDGKVDRIKVFASGLNLATGVAVGHGGVYVAQTPYLLFYPDRDGNDEPDGPPEVLLKGFGMEDAHAVVNSLTWGPDGWLYGAQGSTVTANIRGLSFQQGVWRFHPRTKEFELFAEGGGNTWSFDWDANGNLFCGTNWSKYALLHLVQGGYYVKGFEKHGPLSNPYAFGYFPHAEHRGPFKGGHVTIGGLMYQGDAFPESFRGIHIAANILSNAIYWFELDPVGSTFATRQGGDLLIANDERFRPVDLSTGPDGAVYVADWYDLRATHNNTRDDTWDKATGRIYRIAYQGNRQAPRIHLGGLSSADLTGMLEHPNEWFHREARRILAERRDSSIVPVLRARIFEAREHLALEYLWALYVTGGFNEELAQKLLTHSFGPVRMWTARFLSDAREVSPATLECLVALAKSETQIHVRSQLAASARRLASRQALPLLAQLIRRDQDAEDPQLPLLLWWAIESHTATDREALVELLTQPESWTLELVRRHLVGRMARRLASTGSNDDFAACARLLELSPDPGSVDRVLDGIDLGLAGRSFASPPAALGGQLAKLWKKGSPSPTLIRLAGRLGNEEARQKIRSIARTTSVKTEERLTAIELLSQIGGPEELRVLLALLEGEKSDVLTLPIVNGLGRFADPRVGDALLRRSKTMSPTMRERTLDILASRKDWARKLVLSFGPAFRDQPISLARRILQHNDPELQALVEKNWGHVRPSGASDKAEMVRTMAGIVGPVELFSRPGRGFDRTKGKEIFSKRCARCHTLFGEGQTIGPELTGFDRRNLDQLIANIVDPSASIRKEYTGFNVEFKDGRRLTGFILDPTPEAFVVQEAEGEKTVVSAAEVKEIREASISLMPEGLLDDLDHQSLVDFFSYLASK